MKLAIALAAALTVSAVSQAEQYKVQPVHSYVLTDSAGTPRYLVQYNGESNVRRVYSTKPVKPTPQQRAEKPRRPSPKNRFWPTEVM
jgi:hypothetical protein